MRVYVRKNELSGAYLDNYGCPIHQAVSRFVGKRYAVKVFSDRVSLINVDVPYDFAGNTPVYCLPLSNGKAGQVRKYKGLNQGFKVTIKGLEKFVDKV